MMDAPIYDTVSPCGAPVHVDATRGGEMTAIGGPCFPWLGSHACAARINGRWYVWALRGKLTPQTLDHEMKHVDGWPADHPTNWKRKCPSST